MRRLVQNSIRNVRFYDSVADAIAPVKSGDTILMGGFGVCGLPNALCESLVERSDDVGDLSVATCTAGLDTWGAGLLADHGMVKRVMTSYIGECENIIEKYWAGEIEVEFVPQGTLCEKMRSAGAGIPAFFTPTGVGTDVERGGMIVRNANDETPEMFSEKKETREFNGRKYMLENSLYGDVGFVKGWKADKAGNIICRGTALNFNPDCAVASSYTVVEVEEIVEIGEIEPAEIDIQAVHVDAIVCPPPYEKLIEFETYQEEGNGENGDGEGNGFSKENMKDASSREQIARRVALEYQNGMFANVGIGIPTLSSNYIPEGIDITLQSENGILGLGPFPMKEDMDPDYTSASKQTITLLPGASLFKSSDSFSIIRGAHVDFTCLGAMQVSEKGDLANWIIPGKLVKGMGGAMDLVSSGSRVLICMEHNSKDGGMKVMKECTLPLTGVGVVDRVITDIAVLDVVDGKMVLVEKAWWVDVEEVLERTDADIEVSGDLKDIEYSPGRTFF